MVLGALTYAPFSLLNPLISEDTRATLDALYALGTEFRSTAKGVAIHCENLRMAQGTVDARNSGTTIRLVAGIASLLPFRTLLTGDQSLIRRPMSPLVDALTHLGAKCEYLGSVGKPPISVTGPITKSATKIDADISSQFVSSLLIACSQKAGDTHIWLRGEARSKPYVDITIKMMEEFGAQVEERKEEYLVRGEQKLKRDSYTVPGDYSSAAFPLVAAAVTGGEVTVRDLDRNSLQGDRAIIGHLETFGAKVTSRSDSVTVSGGTLRGTSIDVRHTPDLFPVLAVLGAVAEGETTITGGEHLREKESDRISTTSTFLHNMGARITPKKDGCVIRGGEKLKGTSVQTEGDHRILMAATIAGLTASSETTIQDDQSFSVSYPGFLRDLHQLGCRVEVRR